MRFSRRSLLQILAALTAAAPAAAQPARRVSAEAVRRMSTLLGRPVPDDRAEAVGRGLGQTLARLERLRALEIDDEIAPAVTFDPRGAARQRRG